MSRNPITSHQYQAWIHRQLEPEDVLITGNHKRIKPVNIASTWKHFDSLSEADKKVWRENEQDFKRSKKLKDE